MNYTMMHGLTNLKILDRNMMMMMMMMMMIKY